MIKEWQGDEPLWTSFQLNPLTFRTAYHLSTRPAYKNSASPPLAIKGLFRANDDETRRVTPFGFDTSKSQFCLSIVAQPLPDPPFFHRPALFHLTT